MDKVSLSFSLRNIKIERHPVRIVKLPKCLDGPHNTYDRSTNRSRMQHRSRSNTRDGPLLPHQDLVRGSRVAFPMMRATDVTWQSPISPQMFLQPGLGRASTRHLSQPPVGGDWGLPRYRRRPHRPTPISRNFSERISKIQVYHTR